MIYKLIFIFFFSLPCSSFSNNSQSKFTIPSLKDLDIETLLEKQGIIWSFVFLDADQILFTERGGKIKIFSISKKTLEEVKHSIPTKELGQGGLMDLKLHPKFSENKFIYFSHTFEKNKKYTTAITRGLFLNSPPRLDKLETIFEAKALESGSIHFGSRLAFNKNYLFLTIGDRNARHKAQDLSTHHGKVVRIYDDGKIPPDNPFFKTKDALPEIWSYGHRNPQGLSFDLEMKSLYLNEHGPRGGDELNLIEKGKNYGWPVITYGREYYGPKIGKGTHQEGMQQPLYHWTPSIAPSGLLIYSGKVFKNWKGHFFNGALALEHLNKIEWITKDKPKEERLLTSLNERIRAVQEGPEGFIYVSTDSGKIIRIKKNN